jgi:enoyl-CoA hydratase/carnithine racemase
MRSEPIYCETHGEIAHIVLNRPEKRNALNRAIWESIPRVVEAIEADRDVKVVIVRGANRQAFSAGADIAEFEEVHATPESAHAYEEMIRRAYSTLAAIDRPTIAMVSGVCFGGGCALALNCDLRYADETARFCIPPARLGLVYTLQETKRLTDLVGPSKAKEMLMGARVIEAEEALQTGIVTRLFAAEVLERETRAFAVHLCTLSQFTIRAVKSVVAEIDQGECDDNARTQALALDAFTQPDYREGRDAFLEKRVARFTYR